jgi:RND family efflux transporter MFP subunit
MPLRRIDTHPPMQPLASSAQLFVGALALALLGACSKPEATVEPVRAVRTMELQSGQSQQTDEYPAEVKARVESRLAFRVGGKLVKRLVDVGDAVRAGQALAQLDAQDLQLGQDAARASLAAAAANLSIQEAEFKRYKELREQGYISSLELERREATLKAARAQTDQAKAQLSAQSNQARYAVLIADAAGVVVGVDAEPGAVVAAGTPVLRVARDGPRDVVFSVPEDRIAAMRAAMARNDSLQVRLTGAAGQTVTARLREIAAAADAMTRTFQVKADIGAAPIRLGQTATVAYRGPAVAGALLLPLPAVFEHKGQSAVWLLDKPTMTVKVMPVVVAGADGNQVRIASGLSAGQTVVTAGVHALTPGQKVSQYIEPSAAQASAPAAAASR